ncbi:glyceraldehyde-3-phosphate dehydrogenase [Ferrimonas sp. SCSIO 43195]|uniref:glyceraldehyde-3-phosphate dehydrogenase n=1 Tax=Ferrimonas sp. SCSIO 43195 TaxID=2822844 RepID=UPI0020758B93|nr:glyceraldehyde-3-phosphate dehydrogenase [Ferrimonas sp. SCSIO 43195]USD39046.1 glyceraldehyde-3-phosphate dehydrogenase [Ferrimonas sp. SCSIO 43195]
MTARCLLLALLACSPGSQAISFFDPMDGQFDMGEYLANNAYGFLPVPILVTEPAVGYGGGLAGLFLHESEAQKEQRRQLAETSVKGGAQLLTPALTVVGGLATDNDTWITFAGHRRSWQQDAIRYTLMGGYGDVHMTFYGPKDSDKNRGVTLAMEGPGLVQKLQFRVGESALLLGLSQKLFAADFTLDVAPGQVVGDFINLSPTVSSLGLLAELDTKNSFLFPTDGYQYTAEYLLFRQALGGDYDFDALTLSAIHYWPLDKRWTLGFKGVYKSVTTDEVRLPAPAYPDIDLRGIARNRYQGNYTAAIETQMMWEVTPRWLTSAFAGLGSATAKGQDLFREDNAFAYGVGFRYLIARRYGLRTGIDVAFSEFDDAFYFTVGTGF